MVGIKNEANALLTFAVVRDVTETRHIREALLRAKIAEENNTSLAFAAVHDELTRLPNRVYFRKALNEILAKCGPGEPEPAVLFIDLDRFKLINVGLGHHSGDVLLVARSRASAGLLAGRGHARPTRRRRIRRLHRPAGGPTKNSIESRSGFSDLSPCPSSSRAWRCTPPRASASRMGGGPRTKMRTICYETPTLAMYRAKALGRGRREHFRAGTSREFGALVATRLATCATRSSVVRVTTFFQPIVKLSNQRLCGFEALVRWRHPVAGLIPPSEFISIAEDTGLIVELGAFVLDEACAQLRSWLDTYPHYPDLWVSVNVSPLQLARSGLPRAHREHARTARRARAPLAPRDNGIDDRKQLRSDRAAAGRDSRERRAHRGRRLRHGLLVASISRQAARRYAQDRSLVRERPRRRRCESQDRPHR